MPKGDRENFKADCDDGFTRIANLLLEALAIARLNGIQKGICLFLFRRTYGWNRSEDAISLGEFADACGTSKEYISRQLTSLIKRNIVCRRDYQPGKVPVYAFVTSVGEWDRSCIDLENINKNTNCGIYLCSEKRSRGLHENTIPIEKGLYNRTIQGLNDCTIQGLHKSTRADQLSIFEPPPSETAVNKEEKTVKEKDSYSCDSPPYQLSELLLNKILEHLPGFKKPDLQQWARQLDLLIRVDQRPPEEVKAVINFAQADVFWQGNILSAKKLRKQYDQLNYKRLHARASPASQQYKSDELDGEEADEYKGFYN